MRMREGVLNGQKLFDETKKKGYCGGITILRDWIRPFREDDEVYREERVRKGKDKLDDISCQT